MLAVLSLVALIADQNAARSLTATTAVEQVVEPLAPLPAAAPASALELRWPSRHSSAEAFLDLSSGTDSLGARAARARLGLDGRLGRFASALSSSFARWSVSVGIDAETMARPRSTPAAADGLRVASIGHGLYLGHGPAPRAELFSSRDYRFAKPSLSPTGVRIGIDGTLFFSRHLGLRLEVSGGSGMYAGLSLIFRPTPIPDQRVVSSTRDP